MLRFMDGALTETHSTLFSFCDVVQFPFLHAYCYFSFVSMLYSAILIKN